MKYNFDPKAHSSALMEDCLAADLGIFYDKGFVEAKASELTVRGQFCKAPFNCFISITNDGWQAGVIGADLGSGEYCLVYVSGLQVISFGFNKVATDEVEMWHFVNECLLAYFFGTKYSAMYVYEGDTRTYGETIYAKDDAEALIMAESMANDKRTFIGLV